ncbi:MAG: DUF1287 domain-containing protein [Acidobacteria bacterium]|nr:DUF1287 domain-containing protein [Acidobacteriota bacterium]
MRTHSHNPQPSSPMGGGVLHIGVATDQRSIDGQRLLFVHNIGQGAKLEDILFSWKIIGHYRFF